MGAKEKKNKHTGRSRDRDSYLRYLLGSRVTTTHAHRSGFRRYNFLEKNLDSFGFLEGRGGGYGTWTQKG